MIVRELIRLLRKCPQDAIVMYDIENSIHNGDLNIVQDANEIETEMRLSVEDVFVGHGTLKGFVWLSDERLED